MKTEKISLTMGIKEQYPIETPKSAGSKAVKTPEKSIKTAPKPKTQKEKTRISSEAKAELKTKAPQKTSKTKEISPQEAKKMMTRLEDHSRGAWPKERLEKEVVYYPYVLKTGERKNPITRKLLGKEKLTEHRKLKFDEALERLAKGKKVTWVPCRWISTNRLYDVEVKGRGLVKNGLGTIEQQLVPSIAVTDDFTFHSFGDMKNFNKAVNQLRDAGYPRLETSDLKQFKDTLPQLIVGKEKKHSNPFLPD